MNDGFNIEESDEDLLNPSSVADFVSKFNAPVLSSEVGDVEFKTDKDFASLSVYRTSDSAKVFEARLYPNQKGICTAWQLGDLITLWMAQNLVHFDSFTFKDSVTGKSMQAQILQCSRISNGASGGFESVKAAPLMSSPAMAIPRWGLIRFHYFKQNESNSWVLAKVSGVSESGDPVQTSVSLTPTVKETAILSIITDLDSLIDACNDVLDEDSQMESIKAVVLIVMSGNSQTSLSGSFYVFNDQDLIGFDFKNCFGLSESIFLHADESPNLDIDVESAVIGHSVVQYDLEQCQSFKVEAQNIPSYEWPRLSQFLTSSEIYSQSKSKRVYILDISTDMCHNYDSLGSAKFTYTFDDDRLIL